MLESDSVLVTQRAVVPMGMAARAKKITRGIAHFSRLYPVGAAGGIILLLIVLMAVASPLIAPYDPLVPDFEFLRTAPNSTFLMGTDIIGRDVLSRIMHGARISLMVAFFSVLIGDGVALAWGVSSGYLGGRFDLISQRFLELFLSFPTLILAMLLLIGLGAGIPTVILAIAITRVPLATRVIRSVAVSAKENDYVGAARAIGASQTRIMVQHVTPQCIAPFLVLATTHLGTVIILEASLGFLGLGIPPPTATWGNMLGSVSSEELTPAWWLVVFPGVAITIAVLAFNLFGDAIRDALDPKQRGTT